MNAPKIKALSWLVAAALTLGLSYYVYDFVTHLEERRAKAEPEVVRTWLQPPKSDDVVTDDLVKYGVVQSTFHRFDWTGKPPPPPAKPVDPTEVKPQKRHRAVADILDILMIQEDSAYPEYSAVYIKYKPSAGVVNPSRGDEYLRIGDTLLKPHENVKVEKISALEGVTFSYGDDEIEHDTIGPRTFDATTEIVRVGADGARLPAEKQTIRKVQDPAPYRPRKTQQLAKNTYRMGTEDARYIADNYTSILSSDVKHRTYTDPRTGRRAGIQVLEVKPGSIASRHGVQEGDIIRSVNGNPVSSIQEAINFANNNKDKYEVWVVEIENMGRVRTVTYQTPAD